MLLCPVDFSFGTAALVRTAAGLARAEPDHALTLLYVAPVAQLGAAAFDPTAVARHFNALRQEPALAGLTLQTVVMAGSPAQVIAQEALALGAS